MAGAARRLRERAVKAALMDQLISSGAVGPGDVAEWLWEDYGIRVRPEWRAVRRAVERSEEITPQDLAVFMLDSGVEPDEGAWDARPRPSLRGGQPRREGE